MKVLIMNCHTANRGDEAAVKALIDSLTEIYPSIEITIALRGLPYQNLSKNVKVIEQYSPISKKRILEYYLMKNINYKFVLTKKARAFIDEVKNADLILHAPGGPSLGDIYYDDELGYIRSYEIAQDFGKPYVFYAPSMGPFLKTERSDIRRKIIEGAEAVIVRDPISKQYLNDFLPELKVYQTLDSAFQYDFKEKENQSKLENFTELNAFLKNHSKVCGITITDLFFHPIWSKREDIKANIEKTVTSFIANLVNEDYGIVFIPQLYGEYEDYSLMKQFMLDEKDFFIIPDNVEQYDTYFQQFLISKLYAVIGMRYHSNIFSAKVGTPFISVSYEQKMLGFMQKEKLTDYCIKIEDLSEDELNKKMDLLVKNYETYRKTLIDRHDILKKESFASTEIVVNTINRLVIK